MFVKKELIKPDALERRDYQINIAKQSEEQSTLVVLPTGMGKTVVALLLIAHHLKKNKDKKILFLAPTKPLASQHFRFLLRFLEVDEAKITLFTGEVSPKKRKQLWEDSTIVVSTPQVIENDLVNRRIDLKEVGFIVFDEVHRAVGNYAYVFIGEVYNNQVKNPLVLGITASPGNDVEKILEVCKNIGIKHIEIRTKKDLDVKPYIQELKIHWKEVELPQDFNRVVVLLQKALSKRLYDLKDLKIIESASLSLLNRRRLLELQSIIQSKIRSELNPPKELFRAASIQNAALKLYHGIELLQTQGINALLNYFSRMGREAKSKQGSKASREVISDPLVVEALAYAHDISVQHPKIPAVKEIVNHQLQLNAKSKIIVFTNYRATASYVLRELEEIKNAKPVRFVGQAKTQDDKGLSQKDQIGVIDDFRSGTYNILVATSVAEEGLDIPATDLVVFYEPVPSEIRSIQRRGRTGRQMTGKVVVLITKGTADEGYHWSAKRKEKQMIRQLELLRASLQNKIQGFSEQSSDSLKQKNAVNESQATLPLEKNESSSEVKIVVDNRESRSKIVRFLAVKQEVLVESKQLEVGDYVLSSRIGVERKEVDDFLNSMLNGRLFVQMKNLREAYARPVLILEGEDLLERRNINHNAIFGALSSIVVDYGIAVFQTKSARETADVLYVMARREQFRDQKEVAIRSGKVAMSLGEQQRFIVEGLPNVSAVLAKRLLSHFGSIYALVNANVEELAEVQGIGKQSAEQIYYTLRSDYEVKKEKK